MVADKFKVFISWSGQLSQAVAAIWLDLISETFDSVEPFMSEENIGAGERGLVKIATELAGTSFGIIIVTQENQNSPWLELRGRCAVQGCCRRDGPTRAVPGRL